MGIGKLIGNFKNAVFKPREDKDDDAAQKKSRHLKKEMIKDNFKELSMDVELANKLAASLKDVDSEEEFKFKADLVLTGAQNVKAYKNIEHILDIANDKVKDDTIEKVRDGVKVGLSLKKMHEGDSKAIKQLEEKKEVIEVKSKNVKEKNKR